MHLTEIIVLNRMSMKTHVMTDFGRRGGIYSNVIPSAVTNFLDVERRKSYRHKLQNTFVKCTWP